MLKEQKLVELKILAGENGLNKEVRKVTVLDAPDSPKWLEGKEFILTSTYMFGGQEDKMYSFVKELINSGASGLGMKNERYLVKIPESIIELCNRLDFPFIKIPYKFVWSDIIGLFYELSYRTSGGKSLIEIEEKKLIEVYEASRWGSYQLMRKLTDLYNIPILIVDGRKRVITDNRLPKTEIILKTINNPNLSLTDVEGKTLRIKGGHLFVKAIESTVIGKDHYLAIVSKDKESIIKISDLFELLNKMKLENDFRVGDKDIIYEDFINLLISGKVSHDIINEFQLNRKYKGNTYTGIIRIKGRKCKEVWGKLESIIKDNTSSNNNIFSYFVFEEKINTMVVMLEIVNIGELGESNIFLRKLLLSLDKDWLKQKEVYIYISNLYKKLDKIIDSFRESLETENIGKILWEKQNIVFYNDIYIYSLLDKLGYSDLDLSEIYTLDEKKDQFRFDVIETLERFIENGNYKDAAEELYIHENSLRYRINKLNKLLKIKFEDSYYLYNILLKIKLWRLMESKK